MDQSSVQSPASEHGLRCMEIRGGNQAVHSALSVPGMDAWVVSEVYEGAEQGGDVHYVSLCGAGRISRFMVADVSGHGHTVAALGRTLQGLMRRNINKLDQTRFARALNRAFAADATNGRFATALLATYYTPTDHLIVCNAGHPRPLWYRADRGSWQRLDERTPERADAVGNLPFGVIEPTDYQQFAVELGPGDLVLIYTDSLIEAQAPDGGQLGESGLLELVSRLDAADPASLVPLLSAAVQAHRGGRPPQDDQTFLLLHHNAADPPLPSLGERLRVMGKMLGIGRGSDR